jgi:hypothetical protein
MAEGVVTTFAAELVDAAIGIPGPDWVRIPPTVFNQHTGPIEIP